MRYQLGFSQRARCGSRGEVAGELRARWLGETITQRHRGREDAEGSEENVGWGGGHIDGCGVKLKDTGEVVEGDDHAETQRMARKAQVSGIRYQ
jgi:hypothetical protein